MKESSTDNTQNMNPQNHKSVTSSDKKMSLKEYFQFNEVLMYFFRKKDASRPSNFNLKMMHGINKISIIMFLLGLIYIIVKRLI